MKYIITEEQNDRLFIIRRLPEIMEFVRKLAPYRKPCKSPDLERYPVILKKFFFGSLRFDLDMNTKLEKNQNFTWDIIMKHYGDEIINNYIENCGDI